MRLSRLLFQDLLADREKPGTMIRFPRQVPFCSQQLSLHWKQHGFSSRARAVEWEERACGIVCLRMVLDAFGRASKSSLYSLLTEVYEAGGYREGVGWIHQSLANRAQKSGLKALCQKISRPEQIAEHLRNAHLVVASVAVGFEGAKKGGHLVLVTGANMGTDGVSSFVVHHPSCQEDYEWKDRVVDRGRFWTHFSGNLVAFSEDEP